MGVQQHFYARNPTTIFRLNGSLKEKATPESLIFFVFAYSK